MADGCRFENNASPYLGKGLPIAMEFGMLSC